MTQLSDLAIQVRVVPKAIRWPDASINSSWATLHGCVAAERALVRRVDDDCTKLERIPGLTADALRKGRDEIAEQALKQLADFEPLARAESVVGRQLTDLDQKLALPSPPEEADAIRAMVKDQKSAIDFLLRSLPDRRIIGAVLGAPAYASGLSQLELDVVRDRAQATLQPKHSELRKALSTALAEAREGAAAARRAIAERCGLHQNTGFGFGQSRRAM